MQIVIEIPDRLIKKVKDHYVNPYEVDEICEAILNGTPLSKNPTNGDVIKAMFPNVRIIEMPEVEVVEVHDGLLGESRNFSWEWWYTPYKEVNADDSN